MYWTGYIYVLLYSTSVISEWLTSHQTFFVSFLGRLAGSGWVVARGLGWRGVVAAGPCRAVGDVVGS